MKVRKKPATVDEYIAGFPPGLRKKLKQFRAVIKKNAPPDITEKIGYGIPAYTYQGMLLYFAVHSKHIGFYAMPSAVRKFARELKTYDCSPGAIRFPLDAELPLTLIGRIVKFRVKENIEKKKARKNQPRMFS